MDIKRFHAQARYSEAVVHNQTVYLSGQLADDLNGDIEAQTRETLAISPTLRDIYLKDMADYAKMNAIWDAWVVPGAAPARATVQAHLYDPNVLVEISVIAATK
ncbi:hypothetical protein LEN26_011378 [Aphanomyces euteiches]|nr:hypothetical protein LEN26_011378 [Aphanomyces euteiches]